MDPAGPRARTVDGSLVSVDLSGFTALAERLSVAGRAGAEELVGRISAVFGSLIEVAGRHGGDVLKFRGDALLLFFPGERHAERACGAASDMQWTIEEVGTGESSAGPFELRMSVGIRSGDCHFFLAEAPQRELLVCGPAASGVFQLEDLAGPGEIMVSGETAGLIPGKWLGDDGRHLTRLERGASTIPGPPDVPGRSLELYVPASLRERLAIEAAGPEHRNVTVAFVKLSGTDELLAAEGSEALLEQVDLLAARVADAVAAYDVTWLESDIDVDALKLYLTAGAPSTTGEDAEGMLRALKLIMSSDVSLPLRAGVNRGHVFTGEIGGETRRTYAVMGDAVNLAARLTSRAEPGAVLATTAVLDRARTLYASDREPLLVKGKELAVMAHDVGEPIGRRDTSRIDTVPVIGRDAELAVLQTALDAARLRQLQAIDLVGEPGIGKSRLVRELQARALGFQQLSAAVDPYSASEPYAIWPELLRPLVGITPDGSRDEAGEVLGAWVQAVTPDLAPWLPLLAAPFAATVPITPEVAALSPERSRERLHSALVSLLERVLLVPTLIVVEDCHWLDDASALLLKELVAVAAPRPWLVCATARPGKASILTPGGPGQRLELRPLAPEAAGALAIAVAEEQALATDVVSTLAARAGGNPFFLRELVFAAQRGAAEELPESVETLLTTRIDTLAPADRTLLRYASVVGPTFDTEMVGEILSAEIPDAGKARRWDSLSEFLVTVGEGDLAFRHELMRATAYEGLPFARRREIHGLVGRALEARAGERVDDEAALLSLHFAEAGDHERAWRYASSAGRRAEAGFANVVAAELFDRALTAADALGAVPAEQTADVAEALGDVCERFGAYDRAAAAYDRVLAELPGSAATESRLAAKRGALREHVGDYAGALALYEEALAALEAQPSDAGLTSNRAELELGVAGVRYRQGSLDDAVAWATRAAAHAQEAQDRARLAHALYVSAAAYNELGSAEGIALCERALPIFRELADFGGMGRTLNNLGIALYYAGRWDEAIDAYRSGQEALRRAGDVVSEATLANNEGEILSDQGRLDEAEEPFAHFLRTSRAAGYTLGEAAGLNNLGRRASRGGRFEDAHRLFAEALELFERIGASSLQSETRARDAECLVLEGRYREAIEELEAVHELDQGEATRALIERTLGYAYHQAREPDRAREHLEVSLELAVNAGSEFEAALSRQALALTGNAEDDAGAADTLARLGVVFIRRPPLP
jgi:class 3 adenylate cyclase/tetratricopeptide (TPR) repeat protein